MTLPQSLDIALALAFAVAVTVVTEDCIRKLYVRTCFIEVDHVLSNTKPEHGERPLVLPATGGGASSGWCWVQRHLCSSR